MVPSKTTYMTYEYYDYKDAGQPVSVISNTRTSVAVSVNNVQTNIPVTNWRDRIAAKSNASGVYTRRLTEVTPGWSRCTTVTKGPSFHREAYQQSNYVNSIPANYVFDDPALSDIALTRLKRKLQSYSGAMNLVTPVAELRELRKTIRSAAELSEHFAYAAYQIYKKHENKRPRKMVKNLAKAWLTYSFGMTPLVSDTKRIAESIAKFLERGNKNVVISGVASKRWCSGDKGDFGHPAPYGAKRAHASSLVHNLSYQWIGGFHIPVDSANDYGALEHFQLKIPSFIPTAWELVPFSWIADYFGTVGPWLEDVFTGIPGQAIYITRTRKYEVIGTDTMRYEKITIPGRIVELYPIVKPSKWRHLDFERTIHTSLPMSALRLKTVDEMGLHSVNKLLNLLSVIGANRR